MLLALVSVLPWIVLMKSRCPEMFDKLVVHHFGRFQGQFGTHAAGSAISTWCRCWFCPGRHLSFLAVWRLLRSGEYRDRRWIFLACWFVPGMALLSWSSFKAKHYTIPLLPPLAVLAAVGWFDSCGIATPLESGCGGYCRWSLPSVLGRPWASSRANLSRHAVAALVGLLGVGLLVMCFFESRRQMELTPCSPRPGWWPSASICLSCRPTIRIGPRPTSPTSTTSLPRTSRSTWSNCRTIKSPIISTRKSCGWTLQADFDPRRTGDVERLNIRPAAVARGREWPGRASQRNRPLQPNQQYLTEPDRLIFLRFKRAQTGLQSVSASNAKKLE